MSDVKFHSLSEALYFNFILYLQFFPPLSTFLFNRSLWYSMTLSLVIFLHLDIVPVLRAYFGAGSSTVHLDGIHCYGNESNLLMCPRNTLGMHDCSHNEDAGVICRSRE